MDHLMTLLKPLNDKDHAYTLRTILHSVPPPRRSTYSGTISWGEKKPLLQLAIEPSYTIPEGTSEAITFMATT
jgi:L-arabinose isomerase